LSLSALFTREQKALIIYLYIATFSLHDYFLHDYYVVMIPFWDHNEMSSWSRAAAMRLSTMLVMYGKYGMNFRPHDSVSRAEALQILIRVGSAVYDSVHPVSRQ